MLTYKQLWEDVVGILNQGVTDMGIVGYNVRKANQSNLLTRHKTGLILLDLVDAIHYGWQSHTDFTRGDTLKHREELIVSYEFQLTILEPQTTEEYSTAEDVATLLSMWFQSSKTIEAFRKKGYGIYRIQHISLPHTSSDSDLYEITPALGIMIETVQVLESDLQHIAGITGEVKGE